jgi:hypothetical protein
MIESRQLAEYHRERYNDLFQGITQVSNNSDPSIRASGFCTHIYFDPQLKAIFRFQKIEELIPMVFISTPVCFSLV